MFLLQVLGLPEVGTFSSLFPELKLLVCRTLDLKSLLALSAASKELHALCQDPYLWKHLLLRDFGQRHSECKNTVQQHSGMFIEKIVKIVTKFC